MEMNGGESDGHTHTQRSGSQLIWINNKTNNSLDSNKGMQDVPWHPQF